MFFLSSIKTTYVYLLTKKNIIYPLAGCNTKIYLFGIISTRQSQSTKIEIRFHASCEKFLKYPKNTIITIRVLGGAVHVPTLLDTVLGY